MVQSGPEDGEVSFGDDIAAEVARQVFWVAVTIFGVALVVGFCVGWFLK